MPLFVIFVFGAVILGAGAMLSPAWPTKQPRVALGAAFSLAIIIGGTIFYASLFSWDTLVIDYLLFTLVIGIFLGGTLSIGQARAEKQGETLADADQGWPGPQDLFFFLVVALVFALPVFILPVPLGADGQGYGFLALVTREGKTFDTFAPFHPEIEYLYTPGFSALTAYLSQQLNQSIHVVQFGVGAILSLICVWLAYDLGAELRDKRLGRAMALVMLFSLGLYGAFIEAHYPAILGLIFIQAFIVFVTRFLRHHFLADAVAAGLMLGAVFISHPGMSIVAALGYVPWLATIWLSEPRPALKSWLMLVFGIPLVAVASVSPWLNNILHLLQADFASPFERSIDNLRVIVMHHGVWLPPLAVVGAWLGWQRRDAITILAVGWLLFILDFSTTGGIASLLPFLDRFVHPLDIAWHGPIIPYTLLGGAALLWLWDTYITPRIGALTYRQSYAINGLLVVIVGLVALFNQPLLALSKQVLNLPAAFASHADVEVMEWLRENTPPDARILNYPDLHEGGWVPVITERNSVYFPQLPYAQVSTESHDEQASLRVFWEDPANPDHADLLAQADIDYVVVPQIVTQRESFDTAWRWQQPPAWNINMRSDVSAAPYLELVHEIEGAQVFRRIP